MKCDVVLENLDCAILVVDYESVVQRVNIACEALFCKSRRHLVGISLVDLLPHDFVQSKLKACFQRNTQYTLREVAINLNGKTALVDITLSCVTNQQGIAPSVLIEINSINRISRFMKEKNQLERQQSFRLMMRGLAHEIKNPLGGIRGASQLLDRELVDPTQKEFTDILIKEADRLTRLVDRVMGSRDALKPESLNVHEVLEHVVHLVSVDTKKPPIINRFYDPALPEIQADKEQLIQAVLNIVCNAIEAQSKAKKTVIGFITQFERFVTINQVMFRRALKIQIWDEGSGVPDDMKEIIFDPLITGRPEGTGLGLSITQEIVQRHKGVVQLEEYKGNTCFSMYLPYLEEGEYE